MSVGTTAFLTNVTSLPPGKFSNFISVWLRQLPSSLLPIYYLLTTLEFAFVKGYILRELSYKP
jgi:hypothetical protein